MTDNGLSDSQNWETLPNGLRRLSTPPGPRFQAFDAVGFEWNIFQIPLPNLPPALEGFRILHISDAHCRKTWQKAYDDLHIRIAANPPDLLLFSGDFVENKMRPAKAIPTIRRLVEGFSARLGVFGIRGNHDPRLPENLFANTPMQWLTGQRKLIGSPEPFLELIAPNGAEREDLTYSFLKSIPKKSPHIPRLIMAHYPDQIRRLNILEPDLYLTGHTHGGQICPPNGLPLIRHDSTPRRLCTGIHRYNNTWFIVNRGIGFSSFPFRLFCPAEVLELRLTNQTTNLHE